MPRGHNIAVVGCGVAGATVATLLARQGHRVTLFEQSERVGPAGAGILLQPSGQAVLREMGLLNEVVAGAERIEEIHATTHRGNELVRLRYADLYAGCVSYGLHRGDLFTVLHRAMLSASVTLRLMQPVVSFRQDADQVTPLDDGERSLGAFDLMIAADGARSRLRQSANIRQWSMPYGHGAIWVVGRNDGVRGQLRQVTRGTRQICGLLPMGGGRCSLFWGLHQRDRDALWSRGSDAWRDEVLSLQPEAKPMFDDVRHFDQVKFVRYQHTWMSRWRTGRVVFIGDAAHAMSPHLGQGVNLALSDARELCISIAGTASLDTALACYEQRRRRVLREYGAVTFAIAPFFQSSLPILGWGRDIALPTFPKLRPLRTLMLRTLSGLLGNRKRLQP